DVRNGDREAGLRAHYGRDRVLFRDHRDRERACRHRIRVHRSAHADAAVGKTATMQNTATVIEPTGQLASADLTAVATRKPRSLWTNAWRRLRRNKMAMVAIGVLIFLIFVAIFAPVIAPHNPVTSDVGAAGTYRNAAWIDNPN